MGDVKESQDRWPEYSIERAFLALREILVRKYDAQILDQSEKMGRFKKSLNLPITDLNLLFSLGAYTITLEPLFS